MALASLMRQQLSIKNVEECGRRWTKTDDLRPLTNSISKNVQFTYQTKFTGKVHHFGTPSEYLFLAEDDASGQVLDLVQNCGALLSSLVAIFSHRWPSRAGKTWIGSGRAPKISEFVDKRVRNSHRLGPQEYRVLRRMSIRTLAKADRHGQCELGMKHMHSHCAR